jgi:hypothetical protein
MISSYQSNLESIKSACNESYFESTFPDVQSQLEAKISIKITLELREIENALEIIHERVKKFDNLMKITVEHLEPEEMQEHDSKNFDDIQVYHKLNILLKKSWKIIFEIEEYSHSQDLACFNSALGETISLCFK